MNTVYSPFPGMAAWFAQGLRLGRSEIIEDWEAVAGVQTKQHVLCPKYPPSDILLRTFGKI